MDRSLRRSLMPSGPRVARPASRAWNTVKTLGQIVVMWTALLGLVPAAIAWLEQRFAGPRLPDTGLLGLALFAAGSLFGLVTANALVRDGHGTPLPLDTARDLVIAGPYRHVRNPMAIFGFAQAVGIGLWLRSPGVLAYTAVGIAIWQLLARPWEEADLERRFGDRYRRYRAAVPCWMPRCAAYEDSARLTDGTDMTRAEPNGSGTGGAADAPARTTGPHPEPR
jgi:protein-S-isoprenylcysteine O-methyltransferase Ste14